MARTAFVSFLSLVSLAGGALAAGCVDFTGLGADRGRLVEGPESRADAGADAAAGAASDANAGVADASCVPTCAPGCRSGLVKDGCGGTCPVTCAAGNACVGGTCIAAQSETGATTGGLAGAGLGDCGATRRDACARSVLVSGGSFDRGVDTTRPATVSDFRLDTYEITVGRFRRFVDAWSGGWRPVEGSGKHAHLNEGRGLAATSSGFEPGWSSAWAAYVGAPSADAHVPTAPGAATRAAWDAVLACDARFATWTPAPGPNEARPMVCLSFYDVDAFCNWDGGFLPSETEWEYAAAGGDEERPYPWGSAPPSEDRATYYVDSTRQCRADGVDGCTLADLLVVGSKASGAGRWGHADLGGGVWEWTFDWQRFDALGRCADCTELTPGEYRSMRGGSFISEVAALAPAYRAGSLSAQRNFFVGGRCARRP